MLLQFTVGNYKSFRERATLSLEATGDDWLEEENVAVGGGHRLLKSAAIYGPNASGKSNFLAAMRCFQFWVQRSSQTQAEDRIRVAPFRLHVETEQAPTFFEVVFVQNGSRYRYGYEATASVIVSEWLFRQRNSIREARLFTRAGSQIDPSDGFREGKGLENRTRPDALFLWVSAQFNGEIATEVMRWMYRFTGISVGTSAFDDFWCKNFTIGKLMDKEYASLIRELTRKADVGVEDVRAPDIPPDEMGTTGIKTRHRKFGPGQEPAGEVEFDLDSDESAGTRQFLGLTGPLLYAVKEGFILSVDELEAHLHPQLTKALVGLFNSSANTKNAQLIFATHDEGLLDPKRIRRDQVWFVEKDDFGASRLYSLAEFKGVRKGAKFAKEYLLGQFGAVPHLGDFEETLIHGRE
jgi:uncharacterized protein